jgi:hypothetical protein
VCSSPSSCMRTNSEHPALPGQADSAVQPARQRDAMETIANLVAKLWEHGQHFLWGCAAACVLAFGLLLGGSLLGFAAATAMLGTYGLPVLIAVVVFISLGAARSWEGRPKRTLFFVPDEAQCIWGHSRQQNGEVFTSFNIRMNVTNVSESAAHISKPRIVWPLRARLCEVVTAVLMTQDTSTFHVGQAFGIPPHSRTLATGVIALKRPVCRAGKRLTFVVSVTDHTGKRHLVKFRKVRSINTGVTAALEVPGGNTK